MSKLTVAGQLAKMRWDKTTPEERKKHSRKMTRALKKKLKEKKLLTKA